MEEKGTNHQQDDNLWKIALAFLCAAILGYGFFYSTNTTTNLWFLIGYNLPLTLIIWGVFYAAVTRKRGAKIVGFSFLAIFVSAIASDLIGYSQQKHQAKTALSEITAVYSDLIESGSDPQGLPKRIEKPVDRIPKARGAVGEAERFMKESMDRMRSLRNDYLLELDAIGWNSILDPSRLKADKTLTESELIIKQAKAVLTRNKKRFRESLEIYRDNISALSVRESSKRNMRSGFDRGMEKAKASIDVMYLLEAKVIDEVENMITLLSAKKGAWAVEGENIMFYNDSDLERFNSYHASIQSIIQQQEEITRRETQAVKQNLDRLMNEMQ